MSEPNEALMVDFLSWLAKGAKPYGEVMEAWRTSCPRLTIWEDALETGRVDRLVGPEGPRIALTEIGSRWLASHKAQAA